MKPILRLIALQLLVIFSQAQDSQTINTDYDDEPDKTIEDVESMITHNGKCRKDMPTLKIGNILLDKSNYEKFTKENEVFIFGVSDSTCEECCSSEPLLAYLMKLIKEGKLSYQGKEIQIGRINTFDRDSIEFFQARGMMFSQVPQVYIYKKGGFYKYDLDYNKWEFFLHYLNRVLYPTVPLKTEEEVVSFLTNADEGVYKRDYSTPLLKKFDADTINIDDHVSSQRYLTRAIGFFYDKEDYKQEIKGLKAQAQYMSNRDNLRIGLVTDKKLIVKLKKKYKNWFMDVGMSNILVRRYDGEYFKMDMSNDEKTQSYITFINLHSSKPVDQLNREAYTFMESASMPMFIMFVDTEGPYKQASKQLIQDMQQVAPVFEHLFKVFIAEGPQQLAQRRLLGITWSELPSMGFNTLEHNVLPYTRGRPMDKESLTLFFKQVALAQDDSMLTKNQFSIEKQDLTIQDYFITPKYFTQLTREEFVNKVLEDEGVDSLVFFYSTETLSMKQRMDAFFLGIVAEKLKKYGLSKQVKLFAYDTNEEMFPKGVPAGDAPIHDPEGIYGKQLDQQYPALYIFPAYHKNMPFARYPIDKPIVSDAVLAWIRHRSDLNIQYPEDIKGIGGSTEYSNQFFSLIKQEGAIKYTDQINEQPKPKEMNFKNSKAGKKSQKQDHEDL